MLTFQNDNSHRHPKGSIPLKVKQHSAKIVYNSVDQYGFVGENGAAIMSIAQNGSSEPYAKIPISERNVFAANDFKPSASGSLNKSETGPNFCSQLSPIVKNLNDVTKFLKKFEELQYYEYEWKHLAHIVDKMFAVFFTVCALGMALIFKFVFIAQADSPEVLSELHNLCQDNL